MRNSIILTVLMILLSSIFMVTGLNTTEGMETVTEERVTSDYPQQDGGSDDRLFEYRSMWMEGYQIVNLSEVKAVVKLARENNFNCLSPLINGHNLGVFYNSTIFPKYAEVKWDFDPLMELIKEAHKYNIHVMPWFHTMYNYPALRTHPQWRDRSVHGSYSSSWMDPSNPEVRDFLVNETRELFENYPLDGIKLDTIRYGGSSMGYTDIAQQKYIDEGWSDYSDFRRNQITEVVEIIYGTVMDISPWVWVGADIWHSYSSWYYYVFQDSRTWASMGIIDFVTTMSYTTSVTSFTNNLQDNLANFNVPVVSGPYVYVPGNTAHGSVPDEQTGIDILLAQTGSSQTLGALGTCNFAYKFLREWPNYARALRNGPFSEKALCPLKEQNIPVERSKWDFEGDHDRMGWRTTGTGQFYPIDGKWSVVNVDHPAFMSPLLNITAWGINVLEMNMISEARTGKISIYWSSSDTVFLEHMKIEVDIVGTGDWNLYSIHLDASQFWRGPIRYLRIVPSFSTSTNITIDMISIAWMPYSIRNWSCIGPFYNGGSASLLERDFLGGEDEILPSFGEVISGRRWDRYSKERDLVDLSSAIGSYGESVIYSHIYIRSDLHSIVEMRHGNSDGSRIWFNGIEVFHHDSQRSVSPDQNTTYVMMKKGINTLMFKQAVHHNSPSYFLRFTKPGNVSLDGLDFFTNRPILENPIIHRTVEGWISEPNTIVSWEPPINNTGFDHYEISMDDSPFVPYDQEMIELNDLSNGEHSLRVRCIDNLGFPGEVDELSICVDFEMPKISDPIPASNISHEPCLTWTWKDLNIPISGIEGYYVTIIGWYPGSGNERSLVENEYTISNSFSISYDLDDGHRYRAVVKVLSGSGLIYEASSGISVLLDMTPPSSPFGISLDHLRPGTRDYILSWTDSKENSKEGIRFYEVWVRYGNEDWQVLQRTNDQQLQVQRPLGRNMDLKVRAMDHSSLYGEFSSVRSTMNLNPEPQIHLPDYMFEGIPIEFSKKGILDPDGDIVLTRWFVDGSYASSMDVLSLTLEEGDHSIELWVMDDMGSQAKTEEMIYVNKGDTVSPDSDLNGWLKGSSILDIHNPPVNITIYSNRTEYRENSSIEGDNRQFRGMLFDGLMFLSSALLIVLLVVVFIFLLVREIKGYGSFAAPKEEKMDLDKWEQKAFQDRKRFVESLASRPIMENMMGAYNRKTRMISPAPSQRRDQLKNGSGSRSIVKYEPPEISDRDIKFKNRFEDPDIFDEDIEEWDEIEEVDM